MSCLNEISEIKPIYRLLAVALTTLKNGKNPVFFTARLTVLCAALIALAWFERIYLFLPGIFV
jgi:glutathione S-transferase